MQIGLILLVLAFPLLELAVLIKVGQSIGFWWTILLLVGTGLAGGWIVHRQGLSAARRAMQSMNEGRPPLEPVVDSFMLMLAGGLLLLPGLLTDIAALALLVPPVRRTIARWALSRLFTAADVHVQAHEWRSTGHGPGRQHDDPRAGDDRPPRGSGGGSVIDGEWERVDDPKPPPKPIVDGKDRRS